MEGRPGTEPFDSVLRTEGVLSSPCLLLFFPRTSSSDLLVEWIQEKEKAKSCLFLFVSCRVPASLFSLASSGPDPADFVFGAADWPVSPGACV